MRGAQCALTGAVKTEDPSSGIMLQRIDALFICGISELVDLPQIVVPDRCFSKPWSRIHCHMTAALLLLSAIGLQKEQRLRKPTQAA